MELHAIERPTDAFQQGLTVHEIQAVGRRAFGVGTEVLAATELGGGMYNTTYRLDLAGRQEPVVLRAAPAPDRQFHSESELMRNEYASLPWLAPIATLMPRVLGAEWSHETIGRDWMIQSFLPGTPAPELLGSYPRETFPAFFRQMGQITATVHAIRGPHFGPVAGPAYAWWSDAVIASLLNIVADLDGAGLDGSDLRKIADIAAHEAAVLDEIREPRLLTGDLWTVNTMPAPDAPVPTITGVLDMDRRSTRPATSAQSGWNATAWATPPGSRPDTRTWPPSWPDWSELVRTRTGHRAPARCPLHFDVQVAMSIRTRAVRWSARASTSAWSVPVTTTAPRRPALAIAGPTTSPALPVRSGRREPHAHGPRRPARRGSRGVRP
ncbi:aminoglycoside phosphotransferase family protein [Streptomyces sp. MS1.HAVA.3]|uniref:Aminoglycoside phosphotransferase family protein n=1 Tax=Streptomyces caledonius TaxID=3134107 RepID=A0ABU8UFF7_9ACTN